MAVANLGPVWAVRCFAVEFLEASQRTYHRTTWLSTIVEQLSPTVSEACNDAGCISGLHAFDDGWLLKPVKTTMDTTIAGCA